MVRGGTTRRRGRRPSPLPALVLGAALTLSACAPEPIGGWQAPPALQPAGVVLVVAGADPPATIDDSDAAGLGAGGAAAVAPMPTTAIDSGELGLVERRLRNDAIGLAARYVEVPGVPGFTETAEQLVRAAIAATGQPYTPAVFGPEAQLADRGCVAGSASWPAAEVLTRPETGPPGGIGTAITCEVTAAFGHTLIVAMRMVTGGPAGITGDALRTFVLDTASGSVTEGMPEWSPEAPSQLWTAAIELLRQQAGALSTAPVAAPDATQTALAAEALAAAAHPTDGGLLVTLPAGVTSPELEGLGVGPTTAPTELRVDAFTADSWASPERRALLADAGTPFTGVAAGARAPVDCTLLPCIALTYDDGPSPHTPQLLDTLAAHRAAATFYMIGGIAAGRPDVVARAAAEGHELGSHTMNHRTLTKITDAEARGQVRDAAALLAELSGSGVATYRPPYGEIDAETQAAIGMSAVLWTIDTNDWRRPGQAALIERTVGPSRPGDIVLFHDTHADTVEAAGPIIEGLRARGFELVTVSELFGGEVPLAIVRRG